MLRMLGCALLGLAACTAALDAQGDKGKDKDKKKEGVVGKVKAVDYVKESFTITIMVEGAKVGKDRTFLVGKDTKFIGPKGGVSADGLKDDRMGKGYEVRVIPAKDMKTAKEVHLPYRKKAKDKDKKDKGA